MSFYLLKHQQKKAEQPTENITPVEKNLSEKNDTSFFNDLYVAVTQWSFNALEKISSENTDEMNIILNLMTKESIDSINGEDCESINASLNMLVKNSYQIIDYNSNSVLIRSEFNINNVARATFVQLLHKHGVTFWQFYCHWALLNSVGEKDFPIQGFKKQGMELGFF